MWARVGVLFLLALISPVVSSCTTKTKKNPKTDSTSAESKSGHPSANTSVELFRDTAVHPLRLHLSDESMESLRDKPRKYVEGQLKYGDRTFPVSIKLKGHRSFRGIDEKPAIKLRFDKVSPEKRFLGLKRLTLNNMVDDPTRMRESIGYSVYRAAGLAAPRTAYADVTLNGRPMGTYLLVEPIDDVFVASHFGEPIGGLYEAEYGCDFFPPDIERFERDQGPESSREHLASVAEAASTNSPELWADNSTLLRSKDVITYLAVSTLLGDFDGYWHSHNYFLYQDGPRGPWSILPWGIDRVFNDEVDLWGSRGRLAEVCFADAKCSLDYAKRLVEVAHLIESLDLKKKMHAIFAALGNNKHVDRDPWDDTTPEVRQKKRRRMRKFIAKRPQEIRDALICLEGGEERDPDSDGFGCNDCDSRNPEVFPEAVEVCDDIDNDCNGLIDDAPECACETVTVDEDVFHLCEWRMSWSEARDFCESKHLRLASFQNESQSSTVFEAANKLDDNLWWIGASDLAREGTWNWTSGRTLAWSNWDSGQPSDEQCGQDCAALDGVDGGQWVDEHCEQHFPFVCR